MAKDKSKKGAKAQKRLRDLTAKAVRRGEKFKDTLLKIASQTELDTRHPAHSLLRSLDQALGNLQPQEVVEVQPDRAAKAKTKPVVAKRPRAEKSPAAAPKRASKARAPLTPRSKENGSDIAPNASQLLS